MSLGKTDWRGSYQSIGMELAIVSTPPIFSSICESNTRLQGCCLHTRLLRFPRDISTHLRGCDHFHTRLRDCDLYTRLQGCSFHTRLLKPCDISTHFRGCDRFHTRLRDCDFHTWLRSVLCDLCTRLRGVLNNVTLGANESKLVRSHRNQLLIVDIGPLVRFQKCFRQQLMKIQMCGIVKHSYLKRLLQTMRSVFEGDPHPIEHIAMIQRWII